jgi:hypothetical protein
MPITKTTYSSVTPFSSKVASVSVESKQTENNDIIAISLDYDGCGAVLNLDQEIHRTAAKKYPKYHLSCQKESVFFRQYLHDLTCGKSTVLYVGSNRQDHCTDQTGMQEKHTDSCFTSLEKLAQEMGWQFNPLLLADIRKVNGKLTVERGRAMKDRNVKCDDYMLPELHIDPNLNRKLNLICSQLKDIAETYPDRTINFYFFDDDCVLGSTGSMSSIFETIRNYFDRYPYEIPLNVTLILMHFDYYSRAVLRMKNTEPKQELEYARFVGAPKPMYLGCRVS